MSEPHRSASAESNADSLRKRVCKACDRCRMKKSKCDGEYPCSRCKADNAICQFGERKKTHDKVYPKGYVEMLEQQQGQLISGLQEMYHRSLAGRNWSGPTLDESHGHPLTHDVLAALGLLVAKPDNPGEMEAFEEDCEKLQAKLFKAGAAPCVRRKGSFSSESEHSQHDNHMPAARNTPHTAKQAVFGDSFSFSPSPSPLPITPPPRQRQSFPPARQNPFHQHPTHLANDPQLYQPQWLLSNLEHPEAILRSKFALQTPRIENGLSDGFPMDEWADPGFVDSPMESLSPYGATFSNPFGVISSVSELGASIDPMDLEINKWLQVAT